MRPIELGWVLSLSVCGPTFARDWHGSAHVKVRHLQVRHGVLSDGQHACQQPHCDSAAKGLCHCCHSCSANRQQIPCMHSLQHADKLACDWTLDPDFDLVRSSAASGNSLLFLRCEV